MTVRSKPPFIRDFPASHVWLPEGKPQTNGRNEFRQETRPAGDLRFWPAFVLYTQLGVAKCQAEGNWFGRCRPILDTSRNAANHEDAGNMIAHLHTFSVCFLSYNHIHHCMPAFAHLWARYIQKKMDWCLEMPMPGFQRSNCRRMPLICRGSWFHGALFAWNILKPCWNVLGRKTPSIYIYRFFSKTCQPSCQPIWLYMCIVFISFWLNLVQFLILWWL